MSGHLETRWRWIWRIRDFRRQVVNAIFDPIEAAPSTNINSTKLRTVIKWFFDVIFDRIFAGRLPTGAGRGYTPFVMFILSEGLKPAVLELSRLISEEVKSGRGVTAEYDRYATEY